MTPQNRRFYPIRSISPPSENASRGILDNSELGDVTRHDFQKRVKGLSTLNVIGFASPHLSLCFSFSFVVVVDCVHVLDSNDWVDNALKVLPSSGYSLLAIEVINPYMFLFYTRP